MIPDEWERFLEDAFAKGKPATMFIFKGTLYEKVNDKWEPPVPEELVNVFRKALR